MPLMTAPQRQMATLRPENMACTEYCEAKRPTTTDRALEMSRPAPLPVSWRKGCTGRCAPMPEKPPPRARAVMPRTSSAATKTATFMIPAEPALRVPPRL
jgi:hypothetical protein